MIKISMPQIGEEEIKAVNNVLRSNSLTNGPFVRKFENNFSKYIGTKYAIATTSGTTALHTALLSLGIKKGDEIITTPFSFIATTNSICYTGAKPIFVDIDEKTFNINPDLIEEKITNKTKAIVVAHMFGQAYKIDLIKKIAKKHNLYLIEDACQAHGAEYKNKKIGTFGDIACFSFYPTKNMTTGEGGMIVTNNKKIAEICRKIINQGKKSEYKYDFLGFNYRMTDIAAAIGIEQLKKLDKFNKKRIDNAKLYSDLLSTIENIETPYVDRYSKHVFHQYTIKFKNEKIRKKVIKKMLTKGVETKIFYPIPIHKQPIYFNKYKKESYITTEKICKIVLSIPVHPLVNENDIDYIVKIIKGVLK